MAARGDRLARTFVDVADTLVADFDIVDFLTVLTVRCVDLFDLAAAGSGAVRRRQRTAGGGVVERPDAAARAVRAAVRRGTLPRQLPHR